MIRLLISARLDIYLQFCYKNYKPHICLNAECIYFLIYHRECWSRWAISGTLLGTVPSID